MKPTVPNKISDAAKTSSTPCAFNCRSIPAATLTTKPLINLRNQTRRTPRTMDQLAPSRQSVVVVWCPCHSQKWFFVVASPAWTSRTEPQRIQMWQACRRQRRFQRRTEEQMQTNQQPCNRPQDYFWTAGVPCRERTRLLRIEAPQEMCQWRFLNSQHPWSLLLSRSRFYAGLYNTCPSQHIV